MLRDRIPVLLIACLTLGWSPCHAQTEHHEVEVIEDRPQRSPDEKIPDLGAVADLLVQRVNSFRKREKLPGVEVNPRLVATARDFAEYKARTDRFGHTADGAEPGSRATAQGYEFGLLSENLACCFHPDGFTSEALGRKLDELWKGSPGHRANMLDPDVTEAGMAVARGEASGYYYAVQLFGRPASRSVRVEVVNRTEAPLAYRFAGQPFSLPPNEGTIHEQGRPTELVFEFRVDGKPETRSTRILEGKTRIIAAEREGWVRFKKE